MSEINTRIQLLPRGILQKRIGLAMDIGGSLIKTVFVLPSGTKDKLHFKNFSRNELEKALLFLKEHCTFMRPGQVICTTGVGSSVLRKRIKETLKVKVSIVLELTCFTTALKCLLDELPESDIVNPPCESSRQFTQKYMQQWKIMREKQRELVNIPEHMVKQEELKYTIKANLESREVKKGPHPYLLAMLGSGCGILQVTESGYSMVDISSRCGKLFLSLGALLTGEKTFDGLTSLASHGDNERIDMNAAYVKKHLEATDPYQTIADDAMLYSFGQAVGKDPGDFGKEDLARTLLSTICMDLVQVIGLNYYLSGAKSVYVVGSFTDESELCRNELEKYMCLRNASSQIDQGLEPVELKFIKNGGYLGALGALMFGMEQ